MEILDAVEYFANIVREGHKPFTYIFAKQKSRDFWLIFGYIPLEHQYRECSVTIDSHLLQVFEGKKDMVHIITKSIARRLRVEFKED